MVHHPISVVPGRAGYREPHLDSLIIYMVHRSPSVWFIALARNSNATYCKLSWLDSFENKTSHSGMVTAGAELRRRFLGAVARKSY